MLKKLFPFRKFIINDNGEKIISTILNSAILYQCCHLLEAIHKLIVHRGFQKKCDTAIKKSLHIFLCPSLLFSLKKAQRYIFSTFSIQYLTTYLLYPLLQETEWYTVSRRSLNVRDSFQERYCSVIVHCASIIECTYRNLDAIAHSINLFIMLLYWILQAVVTLVFVFLNIGKVQ